jgi:hypothetical protein
MKTLITADETFNGGGPETNQTVIGLPNSKLGEHGVRGPSLAGYVRPVQSGRSSVQGYDESDLMKSQMG